MSNPGILSPDDVLDLRPPEAKVRDEIEHSRHLDAEAEEVERLREENERLQRQIEVLQLALLREQAELAAAERVIEAARYHRNDFGAQHLDETLREYDKNLKPRLSQRAK